MNNIKDVQHGLLIAVLALMLGALWAAYIATHHEQLHGAFEAQEEKIQQSRLQYLLEDMSMVAMNSLHDHPSNMPADHSHASTAPHAAGGGHSASAQHSHSGSLARDAMQRLLRGHIHFMGIGTLIAALLLIVAFTSLKSCWKKLLGWTFGLGALAYPPAWIIMGFRTVEMGPQAAEASIMWLFGPAVALLLASMGALFGVLLVETLKWQNKKLFRFLFNTNKVT
ncbi:MAG: hypothetical protein Q9M12_03220, partial [Mariprofundus sp.]|nr:hypothetical protein [Mariprofundus sp.]